MQEVFEILLENLKFTARLLAGSFQHVTGFTDIQHRLLLVFANGNLIDTGTDCLRELILKERNLHFLCGCALASGSIPEEKNVCISLSLPQVSLPSGHLPVT